MFWQRSVVLSVDCESLVVFGKLCFTFTCSCLNFFHHRVLNSYSLISHCLLCLQEARRSMLLAVLSRMVGDSASADLNVCAFAAKMDRFLPGDIVAVVDRAIHSSAVRTLVGSSSSGVCEEDFWTALDGYTPVVLRGIRQAGGEHKMTWNDVGGLDEVKSMLRRSLQWPAKVSFVV